MDLFFLLYFFLIIQRVVELLIAKRNEKWMKRQGAIEFGQAHYRIMVLLHMMFFISFLFEVRMYEKQLTTAWPVLIGIFFFTQVIRVWALSSLGKYWNTKIIVLPDANIVKKGPYRYLKHPNYAVVILEFLVIPLLFNAYITTVLFSVLNVAILSVRIPAEEQALSNLTEYKETFFGLRRFFPINVKKV